MKHALIILFLMALSCQLNAQADWVGKDFGLYQGCEFRVKPLKDTSIGYEGFFVHSRQFKTSDTTGMGATFPIFPNGKGASRYDSLVGRKFKFKSISPRGSRYFMRLTNDSIGTVYYKFTPDFPMGFCLEPVGEIKVPDGFFCGKIESREDKFGGTVTKSSPLSEPVMFEKVVSKGRTTFYLRLETYGSTPSWGKGVSILLSNGQRITRPNESNNVYVSSSGGFDHSAYIQLSPAEVVKLQKHSITDFKIYIYEETGIPGRRYQEFLKCLINEK